MHIVQNLDYGGVTNVIANLIKALHKLNHENIVVTPQIRAELQSSLRQYTSKIYLLGGNIKPFNSIEYILLKRKRIEDIVKREKPDAIIIQPGWLSLISNFLPNDICTLVVVHGTYLNEIKYMWSHPIRGSERVRYIMGVCSSQAIE